MDVQLCNKYNVVVPLFIYKMVDKPCPGRQMEISRQEFHLKRIKFIANMTVQAVCTTKTEGLRYTQKKFYSVFSNYCVVVSIIFGV